VKTFDRENALDYFATSQDMGGKSFITSLPDHIVPDMTLLKTPLELNMQGEEKVFFPLSYFNQIYLFVSLSLGLLS
jgi:hypothetical protein